MSGDEDSGSNVIPFEEIAATLRANKDANAPKAALVRTDPGYCFHHRFEVAEKSRKVTCIECKKIFDPIDALLEIANSWHHYESNRRSCVKEIERLEAEKKDLKHEVKNLRAMRNRLREAVAKPRS